jgi:alkylation response protein AidB-like acyl-CoA dehydrogenase
MSQATQAQTPAQDARPGAAAPDLLYTEDETALREAVRGLLADQASWRDVLDRTESGETYNTALWAQLARQVGVAGLLMAEDAGSAVVATTALLSVGDELVPELASGEVTAALAVPFASVPGARPAPTVRIDGAGPGDPAGTYRLTGTVTGIADALTADVLLVPGDGVPYGLYAVRTDDEGVTRTAVTSLDMTRQLCDLTLDGVPARQVASGEAAGQAVESAITAGAGILASEQLGVAERCLEMTVAYVKERRQFARTVGSFQAIKHRLADLYVTVVQARAVARYAADCLASGSPDIPVAVALAKATCSDAALKAAQETIQLHGGIGFTWEHPAHLYLKRAKADSLAFGTADFHRGSLAGLADLPPAGAAGA